MGSLCNKEAQKPLLSESDINYNFSNSKISEKDFTPIKLIGKGSYGNVFLVRFQKNNQVYAMKVLSKSLLREQSQEINTKTERNLMVQMHSPFIVNIKFAFQNDSKLFLVEEFLQGGDLFFHLHTNPKFSNEKAKFYIVELVLAIEFLHKNNMLYRDLKPENILIGVDGHIKITDFGLSKILPKTDKTYTICRTVRYLAPEILSGEGYNNAVHWWSLGCIMYEMLVGKIPFKSKNDNLNINVYKKPVRYPQYIDEKAKDLLTKLLEIDPDKRLGNGENGWEDVKSHPYFSDVNWDDAYNKKLKPPFVPKIENETDLKYFENTFTDEPIYNDKGEALYNEDDDEYEENYKGFTYVTGSCNELKNVFNQENKSNDYDIDNDNDNED